MEESPNRSEYFVVMVGNDLVCVFIPCILVPYTLHSITVSHSHYRLRSMCAVCVRSFWCYTDDQAITRQRHEIESERLAVPQRKWKYHEKIRTRSHFWFLLFCGGCVRIIIYYPAACGISTDTDTDTKHNARISKRNCLAEFSSFVLDSIFFLRVVMN